MPRDQHLKRFGSPPAEAIRAELDRVLAHPSFAGSQALSRLLRYLVDETLEGRSQHLKEYSLGVAVLKRGDEFDPRVDPIVRVQARNLRARLTEYYEGPGRANPTIIELPKGAYVPVFRSADQHEPTTVSTTPARMRTAVMAAAIALIVLSGIWALRAVRSMQSTAATVKPSIAVLPFADMSPRKDQEHFSDGLTDELINSLSKLDGLHVVARTSTFRYKGQGGDVREIGRQLGVSSVLEGSVRRDGERLRISAQLIDVNSGYHLWSGTFDREMKGVFSLQEEISDAIVDTLRVKLAGAKPRCDRCRTENSEAYNLYLEGRYLTNRFTESSLRKAVEAFQAAIKLDARFAPAHSGLAETYNLLVQFGHMRPRDGMPKAKEAARRALELAPDLAEAHTALAAIIEAYDWDWQAAEHEYLAALRLNPNSALCHFWYAGFLWDQGRLKEASREVRRAYELDPLWVPGNLYLARLLMIEKEYDKAARQYRRTLDLDPNNAGAHVHLGWIYLEKSMPAEAAMEFEKARSLSENSPAMLASLAYAYARLGKQDKVPELLLELDQLSTKRYVSPFHRAQIYGVLKDRQALEWLEKAYDERCAGMIWLRHKEKFAFLETDPRFRELVARMRFVS